MTDEDFDFLEKVYNKLRSAKVTDSSVRLNDYIKESRGYYGYVV